MSSVLVVDDETDIVAALAEVLRMERWDVEVVFDGRSAIEALERAPFDVVVSDMMMPRMTGEQLLVHLRGDDRWRRLPVLIVSGAPLNQRTRSLATATMSKPFDIDALLAQLDAWRPAAG